MSAEPTPSTMRAVVQDRYGTADDLRLDQIPVPTPSEREVLVKVDAAAIDRGTWHVMTGKPLLARLGLGLRRPRDRVVGRDVTGTVVAVGAAVKDWSVGDAVIGIGRGSLAEYCRVRQDRLARRPSDLPPEQAAVLGISGGTALQAIDRAQLQQGHRVLITGASGGVGSHAVQIAVARGAEVTGVASTAKLDFVRSLGAAHTIDYLLQDPMDGTTPYDAIIDIAGNAPLRRLRGRLTESGTLVVVGGETGGRLLGGFDRLLRAAIWSPFVGQHLRALTSVERGSDTARLVELVEAGKLKPPLDQVYPLDETAEAMRQLTSGDVRGKMAIDVALDASKGV